MNRYLGNMLASVLVIGSVCGPLAGCSPSETAQAPAATAPHPKAPEPVKSPITDITASGTSPRRIAAEQRTTLDDVGYYPPIGSRTTLSLYDDEKSILVGRLEKLISSQVGRPVTVPMAWAYREEGGDTTVCGAYPGASESIIFVYNSGGSKGADPSLYLNIDEATYAAFGCGDQAAQRLVGMATTAAK